MPVINYTASSTNWKAPVPLVRVWPWGGGGTGGPAQTTSGNKGGGGGGGEFALAWVRVQPGSTYAVAVGQTAGGTSSVVNGNPSSFGATLLTANVGTGGALNAAAGAGGGAGGTGGTTDAAATIIARHDGGRGGHVNGTTNTGP